MDFNTTQFDPFAENLVMPKRTGSYNGKGGFKQY